MSLAPASPLIVATLALLAALLFQQLGRAPGARDLRCFSLLASCAAIDLAAMSLGVTAVPPRWIVLANQLGTAAAGLHAATWLDYAAARERRDLTTWERRFRGVTIAAGLAALVPGLVFSGETTRHASGHVDPRPGPLALLVFPLFVGVVAWPLLRWLREALAGDAEAGWHALALALLGATAVNDALVSANVLTTPLLLPAGFLATLLAASLALARRSATEGGQLEQLQRALEARVLARSAELALAREELARREYAGAFGRLTGGLAHELNGPAAVVSSTLAFLDEPDVTEEERRTARGEALEALDRMRRITARLGRVGLAASPAAALPEELAVAPLLARVAATTQGARIRPGPALLFRGPEAALFEVLSELTQNAAQAHARVGRPGLIELSATLAGDALELAVDDDGPGVPEALRATLLEPFGNLARSDERPALGLPAAAGVIRALGGRLELLPRPGGGTRAVVTLPGAARRAP